MKRFVYGLLIVGGIMGAMPGSARGADDEENKMPDARLLGYTDEKGLAVRAELDASGTAVTYLAMIGLGVLCLSVLFVSSKRTHLD